MKLKKNYKRPLPKIAFILIFSLQKQISICTFLISYAIKFSLISLQISVQQACFNWKMDGNYLENIFYPFYKIVLTLNEIKNPC